MNMRYLNLIVVIFALLLLGVAPRAHSKDLNTEYVRAKIYFAGWNLGSERRFSLQWTREHYQVFLYLKDPDYVAQFVDWLKIPELQKVNKTIVKSSMLPWLVIDLYTPDDSKTTFYSDGCYLFSKNGMYFRAVSDRFRDKFIFSAKVAHSAIVKRLTLSCS